MERRLFLRNEIILDYPASESVDVRVYYYVDWSAGKAGFEEATGRVPFKVVRVSEEIPWYEEHALELAVATVITLFAESRRVIELLTSTSSLSSSYSYGV